MLSIFFESHTVGNETKRQTNVRKMVLYNIVYCFETFLAAAFAVRGRFASAAVSLLALVLFGLAIISEAGSDTILLLSMWGLSVLPRAMMAAAPAYCDVPPSKRAVEAFEEAAATPLPTDPEPQPQPQPKQQQQSQPPPPQPKQPQPLQFRKKVFSVVDTGKPASKPATNLSVMTR